MKKEFLMIPGPTPVHPDISREMSAPVINHRGPKFKDILEEVTAGLKEFFQTENRVLLLSSSGTGAMEAGIVNFLSPGERVVSLINGSFGERLATIAEVYGGAVEKVESEWGEPLDYQYLEELFSQDTSEKIKAVTVVHNESSTGMMNDVARISKIKGDHPALLIVDTVSSLGAVPFPVDEWGIDICFTASQKVLMMPPGIAFISVSPRAWDRMKEAQMSNFYFNLQRMQDFYEIGQTPFTPSLPQIMALRKALELYFEEGRAQVHQRHEINTQAVRAAARALGLDLLVQEEYYASRTVTGILASNGVQVDDLRSRMRNQYGVELAGGFGKLAQKLFRIGHLGAIYEMDVIAAVAALEMVLRQLGQDIPMGRGVAAAQEVVFNHT